MSRPTVGVVVPARDVARFVAETVASIREQPVDDLRCVIVDDGSTDDTVAVAHAAIGGDPRFTVVANHASPGSGGARNAGFDLLGDEVDLVAFMDADDRWRPGALARLVEACERDASAIGAHGLADLVDEQGRPVDEGAFAAFGRERLGCRGGWPRPWPADAPTCLETVLTRSIVFPPGVLLLRAAEVGAVGGFRDEARYSEDWDLLIRLCARGSLVYLDQVLVDYRRHGHNQGARPEVRLATAEVRRRWYHTTEPGSPERRVARDAWRAAQVIDLRDRWRRAAATARRGGLGAAARLVSRTPLVVGRWLRGRPRRRPHLPPGGTVPPGAAPLTASAASASAPAPVEPAGAAASSPSTGPEVVRA